MELESCDSAAARSRLKLTARSPLFTLRQVAKLLDESVDTIFELACDMSPEEGCLTLHDEAFSLDGMALIGTTFTPEGIKYLIAALAKTATAH